jgi:hypothetical protein
MLAAVAAVCLLALWGLAVGALLLLAIHNPLWYIGFKGYKGKLTVLNCY